MAENEIEKIDDTKLSRIDTYQEWQQAQRIPIINGFF